MAKNIEKIYSREKDFRNAKNKYTICAILVIAILTLYFCMKAIEPMVESKCKEVAYHIASDDASCEVKKMAEKYNYDELSIVEKDEQNNIKMIKMNVGLVNLIMAEVEDGVQNGMKQHKQDEIAVPLGIFLEVSY